MRLGVLATACVCAIGFAAVCHMPAPARAADGPEFLPDDAVLGRVEDRVIRVKDFVEAWFTSYAEHRPGPDSLGRVEFLNSMVSKEVLALTAIEADKPLTFEDRHTLREHEQRTLSNVLFQRMVIDSIVISEDQIHETYKQFQVQVRARNICLPTRALAERVRLDLIRGRIAWSDACRKYSTLFREDNPECDMGWLMRTGVDAEMGDEVFTLKPGSISVPLEDPDGFHLIQVVETKPVSAPAVESLRAHIESGLRNMGMADRSNRLQRRLAQQVHMTYDTSAIKASAARFAQPRSFTGGELRINDHVPELSDEDTSLVLARYDGGRYTLGQFVSAYAALSPVARPAVNTFEGMVAQIHAGALEPQRVELARAMGLDRDSMTVELLRQRLEQLRVEQMYQDSVLSKVWVSSDERREYYDANLADFFTYPSVRYMTIVTNSAPLADSLLARLRGGAQPEAVLEEVGVSGRATGGIQEQYSHPPGMNHNLLFEVMRPGDTELVGPDRAGNYGVLHLLERSNGRQLDFNEVQSVIDQSLQNIRSEQMLKALIERHRARYDVDVYPGKVMRVKLVDPAGISR